MAKSILIVDDEEDTAYSIEALLEASGYKVSFVGSREEALRVLDKEPADLILLDIMMPGMRPIDFINKVRGNRKLALTKIAYLSAVSFSEESKRDMVDKGLVMDYICKPFNNDDLLKRVKAILDG